MSYTGWLKNLQQLFFMSRAGKRMAGKHRPYKRLVILSDIHYPSKSVVDETACLNKMHNKKKALEDINHWHDVDLAVFTGDMVQRDGSLSEYERVRSLLRGLKARKAFLAGNHELFYSTDTKGRLISGGFLERIFHFKRYTRFFGPLYHCRRVGGYLLVFLSPDTMNSEAAVELSQQQLTWLDQTLSANSQYPTIIFCHALFPGRLCRLLMDRPARYAVMPYSRQMRWNGSCCLTGRYGSGCPAIPTRGPVMGIS